MPRVLWAIFVLAAVTTSASATQFLRFPLSNSLYPSGAYTSGKIVSVLDHSMVANSAGKYQYGYAAIGGNNNIIVGYTGETASGTPQSSGPGPCIPGNITLNGLVASGAGCLNNPNYTSYDEHPGYDYRAAYSTPVYAAFAGYVVNGPYGPCVLTPTTSGSCVQDWGMVGIDHSSVQPPFIAQPYITQYAHLNKNNIVVSAGQYVTQGQLIGYSGDQGVPGNPHLHFEVLRLFQGSNNYVAANYAVIDPYGWQPGGNTDPLYSRTLFGSAVTNQRLWQ